MFSKVSLLVLLLSPSAWSIVLQCETRRNVVCRSDRAYPSSTEYGLIQIFKENSAHGIVNMTVHWKSSCPDLTTVGPTWYRLEAIGPTKGKGFFYEVEAKWTIERKSYDVLEFVNTNEPSVILDLPRRFIWQYKSEVKQHCFKLTIQHGDSCQQILSPNCEDIVAESANITGHNTTSTPSTVAATVATTVATTIPPTDPPTLTSPKKCRTCDHVNISQQSLTCGSDGVIYPHVCYLRRRRCLYDKYLQRDKSGISCSQKTGSQESTPTPADQNSDYACLYLKRVRRVKEKCDCQGQFKPIQCSQEGTQITCNCYSPGGSVIQRYQSWTFNCTSHLQTPQCI